MRASHQQMISLKLDPEGNNIFSANQYSTSSGHFSTDHQKMTELNSRVKELEAELEKYQVKREGGREGGREGRRVERREGGGRGGGREGGRGREGGGEEVAKKER